MSRCSPSRINQKRWRKRKNLVLKSNARSSRSSSNKNLKSKQRKPSRLSSKETSRAKKKTYTLTQQLLQNKTRSFMKASLAMAVMYVQLSESDTNAVFVRTLIIAQDVKKDSLILMLSSQSRNQARTLSWWLLLCLSRLKRKRRKEAEVAVVELMESLMEDLANGSKSSKLLSNKRMFPLKKSTLWLKKLDLTSQLSLLRKS